MTFFERIAEFFASIPSEIYVLLISVLPIVELRGAIPVGAGLGLPFYINYPLAVIGNLLPIPFILLFIPKVLDFLARFKAFRPMVEWLRSKADKHSAKVLGKEKEKKKSSADGGEATVVGEGLERAGCDGTDGEAESIEPNEKGCARRMSRGVFIALMLFVAIPLPGTGAWTGGLVSSLFGLPKGGSMLSITLGVLISGVIMCLASYGVIGFLSIFL